MVVKRLVPAYIGNVVPLQIFFALLPKASILQATVVRRLVPNIIDNGKNIAGGAWQRQPRANED